MRAPAWFIALLILLIVGIGVYGYFTAPLPFGLNSVIRTPGGRLETALAFETAPDANSLSLHVSLGYGEVELPR